MQATLERQQQEQERMEIEERERELQRIAEVEEEERAAEAEEQRRNEEAARQREKEVAFEQERERYGNRFLPISKSSSLSHSQLVLNPARQRQRTEDNEREWVRSELSTLWIILTTSFQLASLINVVTPRQSCPNPHLCPLECRPQPGMSPSAILNLAPPRNPSHPIPSTHPGWHAVAQQLTKRLCRTLQSVLNIDEVPLLLKHTIPMGTQTVSMDM